MKLVRKLVNSNKTTKHLSSVDQLAAVKLIVSCLLLAFFILSPFTTVLADQNYTGRERADNSEDFDSEFDQQVYQIWSALRSFGMNENQALGVLGNFNMESGCSSYTTEGCTSASVHELTGCNEKGPDMCAWFTESDANRTAYTRCILEHYWSIPVSEIDAGQNSGAQMTNTNGKNFSGSTYFIDGVGLAGIGLAQWTGGRCSALLTWAEENGCDWWVMENQLIWMFETEGDRIQSYIDDTEGMSYSECTAIWLRDFEGGGTSNLSTRQQFAADFYTRLHNKNWDETYGDSIVTGAGLVASHRRNSVTDEAMYYEFLAPTIYYPWSAGMLLIDDDADREARNQDVYRGYVNSLNGQADTSTTYSLFELYGEDLHWYRYMGEATYVPSLVDHIYTLYDQNRLDELNPPSTDIIDNVRNYQSNVYVSNRVYPGRPRVLTTDDINNGYIDPRVSELSRSHFDGYLYVDGSFKLAVSKGLVSFMTLIMGNELINETVDLITDIETTDYWQSVIPVIWFILGLCTIALIVSLVKMIFLYVKGMGSSPVEIVTRFGVGLVCMGMLLASTYNPAIFNRIIANSLGAIDNVFSATIAQSVQNDEVIAVTDPSLGTRAAIWKTAIFGPWCRGQFGYDYNELYTRFSTLDEGQSAMPQSNETANVAEVNTGKPYFNSAQLTGDVFVPVGGGKKIRNWAALLYSCGTQYHIDCTMTDIDDVADPNANAVWPIANTTATNTNIYADMYRIVDAQMNISPKFYNDNTVVYNYTDSHVMNTHFGYQGLVMLFNTALLALIMPAVYQKIKNFVILLVTSFQIIYFSIIELFRPNTGFHTFFETFKKAFLGYFVADIKIYIMVMLYINFVDQGFAKMVIYILLCLTVLGLNFKDVKNLAIDGVHNVKKVATSAKEFKNNTKTEISDFVNKFKRS